MYISFEQLNKGWNAEPNAPESEVEIDGNDILLTFYLNAFQFRGFEEMELGILRFKDC